MTAQYVMQSASALRPHALPTQDLIGRLLALDTRYAKMMGVPVPTDQSASRILLLPDNNVSLYQLYLMCVIDVEKGDEAHYPMDAKLFSILDANFCAAYRRDHEPAKSGKWRVTTEKKEAPACPFFPTH